MYAIQFEIVQKIITMLRYHLYYSSNVGHTHRYSNPKDPSEQFCFQCEYSCQINVNTMNVHTAIIACLLFI